MELLIKDVIENLLYILAIFIGGYLATSTFIKERINSSIVKRIQEELRVKNQLAMAAVVFIQQAFHDLGGKEKYNHAFMWLSERLDQLGLYYEPHELRGLIEDAVKRAKIEFGEKW